MLDLLDGLIKITQTSSLVLGGAIACFIAPNCKNLFLLTIALFLDIAGTTILNMVIDKDIDSLMKRTQSRPIPSRRVSSTIALVIGIIMTLSGILVAFEINTLTGVAAFLGAFIDAVLYSMLLKRRTWLSPLIGGIAGAMPFYGGWVAGGGDPILGLVYIPIITFWSCSHIWALNASFYDDYMRARIPTLVSEFKGSFKYISASVLLIASVLTSFFIGGLSLLLIAITGLYLYFMLKNNFKHSFKIATIWLVLFYILLLLHKLYL
ncbi:protoheme IX farnesyltransferase [Ignicoccus pacificus DSM 13166]|uniref:heme o synthase n=1 Tax=Ignicoccus pacificus DSM 13166 TaxID=940294 RepID=A0A977PKP3_9CREN|nr:protoheme IX farnesyltransferase [Ignicoccus pacificus DSM 13166]